MELRDGNNTANFYGKVIKIEDVADGTGTVQKITVEVTADYLKNMRECTLSDTGGPIDVGNTRYYYKSWEFDAATNTYTFTMDESRGKVEASIDFLIEKNILQERPYLRKGCLSGNSLLYGADERLDQRLCRKGQ